MRKLQNPDALNNFYGNYMHLCVELNIITIIITFLYIFIDILCLKK